MFRSHFPEVADQSWTVWSADAEAIKPADSRNAMGND
jgi:hypothetical protein